MKFKLIERKTGAQFILTGSSARKLRRQGVNLLGGRAAQRFMHPYMAAELGSQFNLDKALRQGMLPVVWAADNPQAILESYNALSREVQVSRKTAEGYLDVLEDLLLGFRLEVFAKRAKRELATHPKFYFFDAGVFRVNRPVGPLDSTSEIDGAALEGLVAQHLRAWCDYSQQKHELFYWQTRSRSEVDFVVYGESGLFAVEVKNAKRIDGTELRALNNFAEDYPEAKRFMLYRGDERFSRDGVLCMPVEEFLLGLKPGNFPS